MSLVATGSGLLFGGDLAGRFRAFDQHSGAVLWETNLGSQVTGFPMTYAVNGRQYVAVSTGKSLGTSMYLLLTPEIHPSDNYNLYVFALPEHLSSVPAARAPTRAATAPVAATATPVKCPHPQRAASMRPSARQRLYTAAQSAAGRSIYTAQQCATCHGGTMQGTAVAPALVGEQFLTTWRGDSLAALSSCIQSTMPPGSAGRLSATEYLDLAAALLEANGIKAE
jgi:alcohol dehydrogenase (cytochrome c)